jgi:CheY-like chemotaxis protein/HPt (histidine-containing phosphotransfer) domain-containing protein
MMRGLGWDATLAGGRAEALALLQEPERRFDVILLDWRMPGLDGIDTAHDIRRGCAQAPVVLMVTSAGREMLLASHDSDGEAPFAGVLTKPVTPRLIADAVARALADPAPMPAPRRTRRLAGMRILVVEDNAVNRQVARELLESEGAQVSVAEDGLQGLEQLLGASMLPDAVLMDMQMPVMDGLEATRQIRRALGESLTIIAMTANAGAGDRIRCLDAGMNGHLGKPIALEALVRALRPAVGKDDGTPGASNTVAGAPMREALARFGDDAAVYLRSLDTFLPEAVTLMAQARSALDAGERAAAGAAIHSLKGAAATIGARALAVTLGGVEGRFMAGEEDADLLAALLPITPVALEEECTRLRDAVLSARPRPDPEGVAPATSGELQELGRWLADGNMRALSIGERIGANAAPGSIEGVLAAQIAGCDFAAARATLARLQGGTPRMP